MSELLVTSMATGQCFAGLGKFMSADIQEENNGFLGTGTPRFIARCLTALHRCVLVHTEGKTLHWQNDYGPCYSFFVAVWNQVDTISGGPLHRIIWSTDRQREGERRFTPL